MAQLQGSVHIEISASALPTGETACIAVMLCASRRQHCFKRAFSFHLSAKDESRKNLG
jgi:hypothetical protein